MKKASIIRKVFFTLHFSLFTLLLVSSCKTVEQETIIERNDTLRELTQQRDSVVHRDSIVHRDSVSVHIYNRNDTVYHVTEHWHSDYHDRSYYHDRSHTDTMYQVCVVGTRSKETVEQKQPWWQDPWFAVAAACLTAVVYVAVSQRRNNQQT